MAKRDPLTLPGAGRTRFLTLNAVRRRSLHNPPIGVTQGGSSRKDAGAKPAATRARRRVLLVERSSKNDAPD